MRVLFMVNIPSPYRVDFFDELGKLCDLTVLYERKNASDREWKSKTAKNFKEIYLKGINIKADSALCFSIIPYLDKSKYDVIVLGGYSTPTGMLALQYMKMRKIPFILNSDGGMVKEDSNIVYRVKKYFISSAKVWLSTGDECDKYLLHYGAQKENIYRYPFTSISERQILEKPLTEKEKKDYKDRLKIEEEIVILSIGQFIYRKGFDVLLKSLKNINCERRIGVYIVGGNETEEYREIVQTLNLKNVYFIPFQNSDIIELYFKAADLFVFPTREDIWGLVINEAMANALPIITTDRCVAGLELIENEKGGYIIPADNENALSDKINQIISNGECREKMPIYNLEKIKDYTIEQMARAHIYIFQKYMSREQQ